MVWLTPLPPPPQLPSDSPAFQKPPQSHISAHQPSAWPLVDLCQCCYGYHSGKLSRSDCHERYREPWTPEDKMVVRLNRRFWTEPHFNKGCWETANTRIIALSPSLSVSRSSSHMHTYAWIRKHAHTAAAAVNPIPVTRENWFRVVISKKPRFWKLCHIRLQVEQVIEPDHWPLHP